MERRRCSRSSKVTTYYAQMRILEEISLKVGAGELVCLLGGNASGKSTTLKTILGLVRAERGPRAARRRGRDRAGRCRERIANGMAIVPENRRLFGQMTVRENLELGAVLRDGESLDEDFERVHTLFPRLHERRDQLAGTLSGGEQQMVAMGRALMSQPALLLMDEPSMGLSPALVQQNFRIIKEVHESGVSRADGRAERDDGAVDRRPRLRAVHRRDRARGPGRRPAQERGSQARVPGRLSLVSRSGRVSRRCTPACRR